jgi:NDP-sugar pyrophosphorylase family protein
LKGAILAAGEGKRLRALLGNLPKPLLRIGDKTLIDRQIELLSNEALDEIVIVIREEAFEIKRYIVQKEHRVPIRIIEKNTNAGMFSFLELEPYMKDTPFFLFTIDTICKKEEAISFMNFCKNTRDPMDIIVGITSFIMDEKPVYVNIDEKNRVKALGRGIGASRFVTSGLYYCSPSIFREKEFALNEKVQHLSDFFGYVVNKRYKVMAYHLGKVIDVDDENDVIEARKLLVNWGEL